MGEAGKRKVNRTWIPEEGMWLVVSDFRWLLLKLLCMYSPRAT